MVDPYSDPHAHEHEFEPVEHESQLLFDDEALLVQQPCNYVERVGAAHSERHDETFYETGYECEVTRTTRYDLTGIASTAPWGPYDYGPLTEDEVPDGFCWGADSREAVLHHDHRWAHPRDYPSDVFRAIQRSLVVDGWALDAGAPHADEFYVVVGADNLTADYVCRFERESTTVGD